MSEVEKTPLVWPKQKARTRVPDQKHNGAWKKPWREYLAALDKELKRMGVSRYVVTYNDPGQIPRDPGVAVWFDRKNDDDFKWQDILGIDNPYPTVDEINSAYRLKVKPVHPDLNPGIDVTPYRYLTMARDQAIKFVRGTEQNHQDRSVPIESASLALSVRLRA